MTTAAIDVRYRLDRLPIEQADRDLTELMELAGRVVVVVGGGGANLGRACVLRFAELGATIAIVGRSSATQVAAELVGHQRGIRVAAYLADATDWPAIHATAERIWSDLGPIDVWVNNVGGATGDGPFQHRTQVDIDAVLARNLKTAIYGSHAVLPLMLERGAGRIINISSDSGKISRPGLGLFCTAKAAVNAFTENLSREVGAQGVRVVAVCPGAMLGDERQALLRGGSAADAGQRSESYADNVLRTVGLTSLGRPSTPDEVATVVAFLATDAASYVHGTSISIGGGISS